MTTPEKSIHRRGPVAAAAVVLAGLALAGCAATNVGDSWQCPLAQGKVCASVAAADPAVPEPAAGQPMLPEPLYTLRDGSGMDGEEAAPVSGPACGTDCGDFAPFAWLGRLFGVDAETEGGERDESSSAVEAGLPAAAAATSPAPPLPAEAGPLRDEPAPEGPPAGDLRTGEVVARIWIAPFVDGNGVYREASHVRVVLEPAGWRLP